MLLGELDLVHLLRSGRAGIKQSESQKRRQQHSQEAPTRGYRVPVSNERHGMVLHLAAAQGSPMFRLVNVSPRSVAHAGEQAYDRFMLPCRQCARVSRVIALSDNTWPPRPVPQIAHAEC